MRCFTTAEEGVGILVGQFQVTEGFIQTAVTVAGSEVLDFEVGGEDLLLELVKNLHQGVVLGRQHETVLEIETDDADEHQIDSTQGYNVDAAGAADMTRVAV